LTAAIYCVIAHSAQVTDLGYSYCSRISILPTEWGVDAVSAAAAA